MCPQFGQMHPACKDSGIHPIFCACVDCTRKVDRWKSIYNKILSTGPQNINQLNLDTTDKTFLPISPTLLQHNEHKEEEEIYDEEPDKNEQIQDVFTTIEEYDDQINHALKIFGDEYTKEQTTDFISRLQKKDVIINTTMFTTKASQFMQEVNAGNVRKSDKSYFFFYQFEDKRRNDILRLGFGKSFVCSSTRITGRSEHTAESEIDKQIHNTDSGRGS